MITNEDTEQYKSFPNQFNKSNQSDSDNTDGESGGNTGNSTNDASGIKRKPVPYEPWKKILNRTAFEQQNIQNPAGMQQQRPPAGMQQQRPPAGTQQQRPPAGMQQQRPPAGTQQQRPPAGMQQQRPPAGMQQQRPPAGMQQQRPPAGTQQQRPPAGTQQQRPTNPVGTQQQRQGSPTKTQQQRPAQKTVEDTSKQNDATQNKWAEKAKNYKTKSQNLLKQMEDRKKMQAANLAHTDKNEKKDVIKELASKSGKSGPREGETYDAYYRRKKGDNLFIVRGVDNGKPAWHYVVLFQDKALRAEFLRKTQGELAGTETINVSDYGNVVESGWGKDPPAEVKKRVEEKHGPN